MSLQTPFTDRFGLDHPIALAPMGDCAGGALAAAVCEGGGLGLIGGGRADRDWLAREVAVVTERTQKPWGIGLLTWAMDQDTVAWVIEQGPAAINLAFGDPTPYAEQIKSAGIDLIIAVTTLDEARRALDLGADLLVAQGGEAGGHIGSQTTATLPLVPMVVDLAGDVPVLAAGGIADGRGLAASLMLGAAGAMIGTRFQATDEAILTPETAQVMLQAQAADTEVNRTLDIARRSPWPAAYPARTLRNSYLDRWRDKGESLPEFPEAMREFAEAEAGEDLDVVPIWVGQDIGLITTIEPAADLVGRIGDEAAASIRAYAVQAAER